MRRQAGGQLRESESLVRREKVAINATHLDKFILIETFFPTPQPTILEGFSSICSNVSSRKFGRKVYTDAR